MSEDVAALQRRMAQAAEAGDFELAAQLRDQLQALGGGTAFQRQRPGAMGLGTDQQVMRPAAGWKPPKKPDPMTKGHKGRGGRQT